MSYQKAPTFSLHWKGSASSQWPDCQKSQSHSPKHPPSQTAFLLCNYIFPLNSKVPRDAWYDTSNLTFIVDIWYFIKMKKTLSWSEVSFFCAVIFAIRTPLETIKRRNTVTVCEETLAKYFNQNWRQQPVLPNIKIGQSLHNTFYKYS